MTKNKIPLGELFFDLDLIGNHEAQRSLEISRIHSVENAREGDLVFVAQEMYLKLLPECQASALVVNEVLFAKAKELLSHGKILLPTKDAMLAMAKVSRHFATEPVALAAIHPSAVIDPSAKLGKNISIGANVVIGKNVELGDGCVLQANVCLMDRVQVGKESNLFPGVIVYQDSILGDRVRIHANTVIGSDGFGYVQEKSASGVKHVKIHHLGRVRIGNDVEIGSNTSIDRGTAGDTIIEDGCIIDNQVQIGHNCHLERGVIVCGNVGFAGSAKVEKFAVVGGMVGVGNKVVIGMGAMISGFSAVSSSVPAKAIWGGVPARSWKEYLKIQAALPRLPGITKTWMKTNRSERDES